MMNHLLHLMLLRGFDKVTQCLFFLFAIAMEYLSRNLNALKENNEFKYHPICAKLGITHLSFADDLLLFARGDLPSVTLIQQCFSEFSTTSSLQENMDKSSVYFGGMAQKEREQILHKLGFGQGELPFKYLGIPLSTKKLSLMQWQPLIDKMVPRISNWTSKKLSYARRIQLVKTVMFGIQAYWAQFFLIPAKIMKAIEEYYRSYIWSGTNFITKRALVAWDKMCTQKCRGGRGLSISLTCICGTELQWLKTIGTLHISKIQCGLNGFTCFI